MRMTTPHTVRAMHSKRPNFVLFITDQQRADHLGAYGNKTVRTPHLDRLASQAWVADRCYVASPICMPNRASLMTGRLPSVHGARHNGIPLSLSEVTFVERLRESGYRTALIGKSHLQNITGAGPIWPPKGAKVTLGEARRPDSGRYDQEWQPTWDAAPDFKIDLPFYGFEDVRLIINHGDTAAGDYKRWLRQEHPDIAALTGPEHALPAEGFELVKARQAWRTRVPEELSTSSYLANETCKKLEHFATVDEPFFMQCSFPDPHHPFTPPGRYWNMYKPDDMQLPISYRHAANEKVPHLQWLQRQRDEGKAIKHTPACFAATEREVREALALNYGAISHVDDAIGKVIAKLRSLDLADNTVVLFTSDHGDFFGDHQLLWKGPLHYQGLTRVPLIWFDPAVPEGRRDTQLCSTIDIAPTILERSGCVPYNGIQGLSLIDAIGNGVDLGREGLVIEEEGQRVIFGFESRVRMRTLQTDRYRLSVYHGTQLGEIYDLHEDPHELHNLWSEEEYAQLRQGLMHMLTQQLIQYADESPNPTALA